MHNLTNNNKKKITPEKLHKQQHLPDRGAPCGQFRRMRFSAFKGEQVDV